MAARGGRTVVGSNLFDQKSALSDQGKARQGCLEWSNKFDPTKDTALSFGIRRKIRVALFQKRHHALQLVLAGRDPVNRLTLDGNRFIEARVLGADNCLKAALA